MPDPRHTEPPQSSPTRRVLIVGLDGATFDVIEPLVGAGRLPHLGRLMKAGACGDLHSTLPPLSPVAWSSFLTGKNPGRHGVFGFEEPAPNSYDFRPVAATRSGHATLWRIASDHGRRVVALDIPFSYPPEAIDGCLIAGYGTPTGEGVAFTHPPELRDELAARFGECEVAVPRMKAAPPREALFRRWDRILENRRRIADHLMRTEDWDVFTIVLGVTDHMQHAAWTYCEPLHRDSRSPEAPRCREALYRYYEKADEFIGQLLDAAGEQIHVIVLSDHGFGTTWRGHLTRRILEEEGWLRYKGLAGRGVVNLLHRAYEAMPWLKRFLHRRPAERRRLKRAIAGAIDWQRTVAFPAALGMQVYINRQEVFPQGVVAPGEEYDSLCARIKERLEAAVAPGSNQRLIRRVWRREEIYRGEAASRAPDLLVEYENLHGMEPAGSAADWDLVGSHAMSGILIASGPEIRPTRLSDSNIMDVAPTVLHLMGLPVPDDMDGRVLEEAFRPEALRARAVRKTSQRTEEPGEEQKAALSPKEAASVREHLRNLGYLD